MLGDRFELRDDDTWVSLEQKTFGTTGAGRQQRTAAHAANPDRKYNLLPKNIDIFKDVLEGFSFDQHWDALEATGGSDQGDNDNDGNTLDNAVDEPEDEEQDGIRTVAVKLSQIVRPDLQGRLGMMTKIFKKTQADLTTFKSELSAIQRLNIISLADGSLLRKIDSTQSSQEDDLVHRQASIKEDIVVHDLAIAPADQEYDDSAMDIDGDVQEYDTIIATDGPSTFNIMALLPDNYLVRDNSLHTSFPLAPLDPRLAVCINDPPKTGPMVGIDKLFSQQHYQFIQSRHLGSRGTQAATKDSMPVWESLSQCIKDSMPDNTEFVGAPAFRSSTFSTVARQMATSTKNLYSSRLYKKSLGILASSLDYFLRPKAMQHRCQRAAELQAARKSMREKAAVSPRTSRKHFKSSLAGLLDDLADSFRRGETSKVRARLELIDAKILHAPPLATQQNRPKLAIAEMDWSSVGATKDKQASDVQDLKRVFTMLIQSPAIHKDVDANWIKKSLSEPDGRTLKHSDYVKTANVINAVRHYIPKRQINTKYPTNPALCIPAVLIADTFLRATGQSSKTMEWLPNVSGSDLHSIHVTAPVLFQVLCSEHDDQFDVKDGQDRNLKLSCVTRPDNKHRLFASFFDIDKIHDICRQYGIRFRYAFTYVDEFTVMLEGDVLHNGENGRAGYPSIDFVDARRKKQKGANRSKAKSNQDEWSEELARLGWSAADVQAELTSVKAELASLKVDVKASEDAIGQLEGNRTYCRNLVDRAIDRSAQEKAQLWAALTDARKKVEACRNGDLHLHEAYQVLKERAWALGRLLRVAEGKEQQESESSPDDNASTSQSQLPQRSLEGAESR
ncbi:hypothetical protein DFQ26_000911, partial [Actinomortierella ambigua]